MQAEIFASQKFVRYPIWSMRYWYRFVNQLFNWNQRYSLNICRVGILEFDNTSIPEATIMIAQ